MGAADNTERLALLQLLLRSEAERLAVWAAPRDVLDPNNRIHLSHTTDQHWSQHLRTAWDFDQRLALCMLERYPATAAVRHELEALVLHNAHDSALQELPEAALLLATPAVAGRNAPELRNLAVWAVCPLLQAMALMAGAAGAQPAVRAYCIRSLQATKPEEVGLALQRLLHRHHTRGIACYAALNCKTLGVVHVDALLMALCVITCKYTSLLCNLHCSCCPSDTAVKCLQA